MAAAAVEARQATERELVNDMAESVSLHGYKVASHTVKEDHEREETTLTVKFIKANPNQGVLDLKGKAKRAAENGQGGD
jgi:hypothetical protein